MRLLTPPLLVFLACVCIALPSPAPQGDRGWQGLIPLHSTKADVERLLGAPEETGFVTWYKTRGDLVGVVYAGSPCQGGALGWNVPADTVLEINVKPQNKYHFAALHFDKSKFAPAVGHVFGLYINLDEGIRYELLPDDTVETVSFIPSTADNRLRCPGFPPYDGGLTQYRPFDEYSDLPVENEGPRLDNLAIALRGDPNMIGYIVVYAGREACVNEAINRARSAREYVLSQRGIKPQQVVAVDGGYREVWSTELYLVHHSDPAPTPRPSISSSEVKIIEGGNARNNYRCPSRPRRKPH